MNGDSRSPRVGCDAAIRRNSKLLLVKRKRLPETNHWGPPGGNVDWLEPVGYPASAFPSWAIWRITRLLSRGSPP